MTCKASRWRGCGRFGRVLLACLLIALGSIGTGRPALANCLSPAGVEGEIFYNGDFKKMQFCDGTDWIGLGAAAAGSSVTDGDKGDISVSGSGANWLINDDALDFTKFKDALTLDASTDIEINGSLVFSLTNTGTGNSFVVNDQAADSTPFLIDTAGKVGIGLTTPTQALDVVGKTTSNSFIAKPVAGLPAPTRDGGGGSRLTPGDSPPSTCDAGRDGMLAATSFYTICICKSGSGWVAASDGSTACSWSQDNTPDAFGFTDVTEQTANTLVSSDTVTINGVGPGSVAAGVTGGGSPQISINAGSWTTSGTISSGQTLQVRLTSSATVNTMLSATVTVGTASDQWDVTTISDPCAGSPNAGDVCADGSVYVGMSPDGPNRMYATRCDYGMSWSGSSCTGTRGTRAWNNGTNTDYDIPTVANCSSAGACSASGKANSAAIAAVTGSGQGGPHQGAAYCEGLSENGKTDWYLPSLPELNLLYTNKTASGLSGTFDTSGNYYWSASEHTSGGAWAEQMGNGSQINNNKRTATYVVRCVRR